GSAVPPQYDSLLAKLVVSGADRAQARARLRAALARLGIGGVATTLPLLSMMVDDAEWVAGGVDTGYLSRCLDRGLGGLGGGAGG
ncbi:MAG TPA: acetyl-CoA carboxylase biotin carboxylase subunit, partial [Streptosporangiaceae bacterium]|nr:acetyl-CoA carboxylase biotin carboxylase subunit [Streptosporangiaceae bacterium]